MPFGLLAQQLPQYSQYMLNDYIINNCFAGTKPFWEAKTNHRYQWEGITDAPRTYIISAFGPSKNMRMGYGGYLFTDYVGPTRRSGLSGSYTYHAKFSEEWKLGMSLNAGIMQFMIDGSKITLREEDDAILTNGVQSAIMPDAGFSFLLHSTKFFLGASAPQILGNRIKFFKEGIQTTGRLERHYFGLVGYKFQADEDFVFEPSLLVKYVEPVPVQLEAALRVIYQNKLWIGGSYRTEDAFSLTLGYDYKQSILFAYSYDFITSNLKNYSYGSHEIMLGIRFGRLQGTKSSSSFQESNNPTSFLIKIQYCDMDYAYIWRNF